MALQLLCNLQKWVEANMPPSYNPVDLCSRSPYYTVEGKNILSGLRESIDPMMQAQMGICGVPSVLNAGSPTTAAGVYYCQIQVITDTVFNVLPGNTSMVDGAENAIDVSALSAITVKAGTTLLGNWTTINLVSGVVIAYPHPFLPI